MDWTTERVRLRLELKPWHVFNVERDQHFETIRKIFSREQWVGELRRGRCYPRQTGRTMYMQLMAVAAAGNGQRVAVYGHDWVYTKRIVNEARWMAKQCDINPLLIRLPERLHPTEQDDVGRDPSAGPQELYDHHYFEHELEKQRARWALERSRNRW